jgi:hypothetical protein
MPSQRRERGIHALCERGRRRLRSGSVMPLRFAMLMLAVGHERPAGPFGSMDPLAPPGRAPIKSPAPRR